MTERRQSARSSAVKERELLEEKLVRRKQAEEVKAQKKRSKALQDLYSPNLISAIKMSQSEHSFL